MRVLFLSGWFPYPPNNGSKLRIYNLLRGLAQRHEVTLLSFADQPDVDTDAPALRALCRDVQVVPWKPFDPQRRQPIARAKLATGVITFSQSTFRLLRKRLVSF